MTGISDTDLQVLIETYSSQKATSLSNHQRNLLAALEELKAFRFMTGWAVEPEADPVVTCPACMHGFRLSAQGDPAKDRFK
jgi:hypothetical protein